MATDDVLARDYVDRNQIEVEKKLNHPLIFSADKPASQADLPKFYKKRGRQRTEAKTKEVIVYRLVRGQWPPGLSDWMCWYYNQRYIKKDGEFYAKTKQWRAEIRSANPARSERNVVQFKRKTD